MSGISFSLMIAVPVRPSYFTSGSNSSNFTPIPILNGNYSPPKSFPSLSGSTPPAQPPAAVSTQKSAGTPSGAAGRYSSVLRVNVNVQADATFLLMLLFWSMAFLALNPLFSLIDALTFTVINRELKSMSELEPNGEGVALTSSQTPSNTCNDLHVAETEKHTITKAEAEKETKQEREMGDPATITTTQPLYPKLTGIDIATETGDASKDEKQIEHRKEKRTPKKADIGAQSARAFGYIRLGGSAGNFLTAVAIAIAALLFASSASVYTHFVLVAIIYDLCSVLTAVTVWFFHSERLDKSVSLLPHVGTKCYHMPIHYFVQIFLLKNITEKSQFYIVYSTFMLEYLNYKHLHTCMYVHLKYSTYKCSTYLRIFVYRIFSNKTTYTRNLVYSIAGRLLRNWHILLALMLCFVEGMFFAQTETFLWWYLEEIGAGPAMRYTVQLVTVLLEVCPDFSRPIRLIRDALLVEEK